MSQGRDLKDLHPFTWFNSQMDMIGLCHCATQRAQPFCSLISRLQDSNLTIRGMHFSYTTWESISWYSGALYIFLPACSLSSWELLFWLIRKEQNISTKVSLSTSSSGSECSQNTTGKKKMWFPTGSWMIPCGACLNKCTVSSEAQLDPMSQPSPWEGTIGREEKSAGVLKIAWQVLRVSVMNNCFFFNSTYHSILIHSYENGFVWKWRYLMAHHFLHH